MGFIRSALGTVPIFFTAPQARGTATYSQSPGCALLWGMTGPRTGQESYRLLVPLVLFAAANVLSPAQTVSVAPLTLTFEV